MIASLPMYDRPELVEAHDAFWSLLRDGLRAADIPAPDRLDRQIGLWEAWEHPDLCFSQTCNLPYRTRLHGKVTLLGAADYGLDGAEPGTYYSVFVVRAGDARPSVEAYRDAVFAFNDGLSQSGWGAPQDWASRRGFRFDALCETGAHRESARAVAEGRADIAAVDAMTWRLLQRHEPCAAELTVIGRTDASPALSFITRAGQDPAPYRTALAQAIVGLPEAHRMAIGLRAVVVLPVDRYLDLVTPDPPRK